MSKRVKSYYEFSRREIYFFKLIALNVDCKTISDFLELSKNEVVGLYNRIAAKTGKVNSFEIIDYAFREGILKEDDYVDLIVKKEAESTAVEICRYINSKHYDFSADYLKERIQNFLADCGDKLLDEHLDLTKNSLGQKRIALIKQKFNLVRDINTQYIEDPIFLGRESKDEEDDLLKKMKVNCWYNAFRKAYHMKIIKTDTINALDLQVRILELGNRIHQIKHAKLHRQKEKILLVYTNLIELYRFIENQALFGRKVAV